MSAGEFAAATGVSRETLARLERYAATLKHWQKAINLVSANSLADLWRRHMLDSAQLMPLLPAGARTLLDIGSGAGFPGLALGLMGVPEVHLVESDARKCAFLAEALRQAAPELRGQLRLHSCRVEALAFFPVDVVTARACAPLPRLLEFSEPFLGSGTICLFLKGEQVDAELTAATKRWNMEIERISSRSDPKGALLRIAHVRRR
jgi:16S rRNA (guanine527-N7)-methyltransferase